MALSLRDDLVVMNAVVRMDVVVAVGTAVALDKVAAVEQTGRVVVADTGSGLAVGTASAASSEFGEGQLREALVSV